LDTDVIGSDPTHDIAVLKVSSKQYNPALSNPLKLIPKSIPKGTSRFLQVGQTCLALPPPPPSTFRYFDSRRCKCPEPRCAPRRQRRGHRVHSSRCYVFFCVVAYLPALLTLVPPPSNLSVAWPWQQWWAIARYSWAVDWYTFLRKPASLSRIFLCG
jgi:hypothetical protein